MEEILKSFEGRSWFGHLDDRSEKVCRGDECQDFDATPTRSYYNIRHILARRKVQNVCVGIAPS